MIKSSSPTKYSFIEVGVFLVEFMIVILGLFAFLIVTHEGYHYFSIDGEPVGVCFGVCDLQGSYDDSGMEVSAWSVAFLNWNVAQDYDIVKEEKAAWAFSLISTLMLMGLLFKMNDPAQNRTEF